MPRTLFSFFANLVLGGLLFNLFALVVVSSISVVMIASQGWETYLADIGRLASEDRIMPLAICYGLLTLWAMFMIQIPARNGRIL